MKSFREYVAQATRAGVKVVITPYANNFGVLEIHAEYEDGNGPEFNGLCFDQKEIAPLRREARGIRGKPGEPLSREDTTPLIGRGRPSKDGF